MPADCADVEHRLDAHRSKLGTQNPKAEKEHAQLAAEYLGCIGPTAMRPKKKYRGR